MNTEMVVFFGVVNVITTNIVLCRHCHEAVNYNTSQRSTSTMRSHIQRKHPHLWEDGQSSSTSGGSRKYSPLKTERAKRK